MLLTNGTLHPGGEWHRRLERGVVDTRGGLSLFTGLFVRPRDGVRVRQSSTANRRSWAYSIEEALLDDPGALCPIVLGIEPAAGIDTLSLEGEVATLGALPAHLELARSPLSDAPAVGRAHLGFYDAAYFETKQRGAVSRKYRDEIARHPPALAAPPSPPNPAPRAASPQALAARAADAPIASASGPDASVIHAPISDSAGVIGPGIVRARVIDAGPASVELAHPVRIHRAAGALQAPAHSPPDRLLLRSAITFTATFDGLRVAVTPDPDQLAGHAREIRAAWERTFGADLPAHPGALLYLTKYFTPHPPGEPHFFLKPAALLETSSGVSTLLDGLCGPGYDVLRGVIRSDRFHATPAVFQLWQPNRSISIARGTPLLELFPCPRSLIEADITRSPGGVTW